MVCSVALHRLTHVELNVPDVAASARFFAQFGLSDLGDGRFGTRDGGEQLRLYEGPARTIRRLGVGVDDSGDVEQVARRLLDRFDGTVVEVSDERVVAVEPVTKLPAEVMVAPRLTPDPPAATDVNRPGDVQRLDRPAAAVLTESAVQPSNLTHIVYGTPDFSQTLGFFVDGLGFEISDVLDGVIAFTRCGEVHHNVALQQSDVAHVHHLAFEVDSFDEVARGGSAMVASDAARHAWGLGRHAIGSNWFWYLREPSGVFVEYAADIDRISANAAYTPKEWSGQELLYAFGPPPPPDFV